MTAHEINQMLSNVNFNSFTDEELRSLRETLSIKETEIKCIQIRRKQMQIHHPLPKDKRTN